MNQAKRQAPQRVRRFQTISLVLLVVCGTINYLDRGALSVANPAIRSDLGVPSGRWGCSSRLLRGVTHWCNSRSAGWWTAWGRARCWA